jgi:hypothetical protein
MAIEAFDVRGPRLGSASGASLAAAQRSFVNRGGPQVQQVALCLEGTVAFGNERGGRRRVGSFDFADVLGREADQCAKPFKRQPLRLSALTEFGAEARRVRGIWIQGIERSAGSMLIHTQKVVGVAGLAVGLLVVHRDETIVGAGAQAGDETHHALRDRVS